MWNLILTNRLTNFLYCWARLHSVKAQPSFHWLIDVNHVERALLIIFIHQIKGNFQCTDTCRFGIFKGHMYFNSTSH